VAYVSRHVRKVITLFDGQVSCKCVTSKIRRRTVKESKAIPAHRVVRRRGSNILKTAGS
jgi:hypothetical protein